MTATLRKVFIVFTTILSCTSVAQVHFIPNEGQWDEDFLFKASFSNNTTFFLDDDHIAFTQVEVQVDPENPTYHGQKITGGHHYRVHFVDALKPEVGTSDPGAYYENFFVGHRSRWRSRVHPVDEVSLYDLYKGVDLKVYTRYGQLKYDLLADNASDLRQVKFYYEGVEEIYIKEERLHVITSVGEVVEIKPYAYHPDSRKAIDARFVLKGDTLSYYIDETYTGPVVLDPTYVFSTFSGSTKNNWGGASTYDPVDGSVYATGVAWLPGVYPVTVGAFDTIPNGVDVVVSKFSADGKSMLYSTYLGGSSSEESHSVVADSTGKLAIMGPTGSFDFPTTPTAVDTSYNGGRNRISWYPDGIDLYVTVMGADGDTLYGSTFMGGSDLDGMNLQINQGGHDGNRGEIIFTDTGTLMLTTTTNSLDIPLVRPYQSTRGYLQSAWLMEMSTECDTLLWSTYYGGDSAEAGYSIRATANGIYACGVTHSSALSSTTGGVYPTPFGKEDGFLTRFDPLTRDCVAMTFMGTPDSDQSCLLDIGPNGDVYVIGQTDGTYPTSPNAINEPNASVFVQQFDSLLMTDKRSLAFGNGNTDLQAISPTAFMVDRCGDVYLSGWAGDYYQYSSSTSGMYVTPDAYQDTTDGADLYFAVIDASFQRFNYATFFGDLSSEEFALGTSTFDPDGVLYQVITGCAFGGSAFPTFPNDVFSRSSGSHCNLAVLVVALEQQDATVNITLPDTVCAPFDLEVSSVITGTDYLIWDFGGGDVDTSATIPFRTYSTPGTYVISVVAVDTNCNTTDTATVEFEVVNSGADASFQLSYDPCDPARVVNLIPQGTGGIYYWDFGDGNRDTTSGPVSHTYAANMTYIVTLRALSGRCPDVPSDMQTEIVTFSDPPSRPSIVLESNGCAGEVVFTVDVPGWDVLEWSLSDGQSGSGDYAEFQIAPGLITVTLTATDVLCNETFTVTETFEVYDDVSAFSSHVPNVFTPDGDGVNDYFQLQEGFEPYGVGQFSLSIYDRWGKPVWESNDVFFKWPGTSGDKVLPEGAYFWVIRASTQCGVEIEENGVVTIMKDSQ